MAPAQSTLRPPFSNINNTSSSSSVLQIIPFNNETRIAFGLMLEGSRDSSREQLSLAERQQMIDWITDTRPRRALTDREAKRILDKGQIFIIKIESSGEILINIIPTKRCTLEEYSLPPIPYQSARDLSELFATKLR